MKEQLYVCNFGIKVIMLQVLPGYEREVVKIFSKELRKLKREFRIFKALGNYDIFIIYESSDYSPDVIDIGTIPHILKSNELLCFPWEIKDESGGKIKDGLDFMIFEKNILGFCFLKINPYHIVQTGTIVEQSIIDFCKRQKNLSILGTFGWNEILILVHGESIQSTFKTLLEISDARLEYQILDKGKKPIVKQQGMLFLKTLSFLGINFHLLEKLQDDPNFLKNTLQERISKKIFPQLYIACCPEFLNDITSEALNRFGQTNIILGAEDVQIYKIDKIRTWGEFFTEVYNFREKNKSKLFSTSIRINWKKEKDKHKLRSKSNQGSMECSYPPVTISKREASIIKKRFGPSFQVWFLNTIYTFDNLIQNNIAKDAFIDMVPFAKEIKNIALSEESKVQALSDCIDHFIFGAQQRASSIYSGIDNIEYRFSVFKGGIQRVLQAIELLPKSMLEKLGMSWNGIVNAGESETYRSELMVLNIPIDCLFAPKKWWGLFHEIGHVVALNSDLLNFSDTPLKDFQMKNMGIFKENSDFTEFAELCWEISADIFDYTLGFVTDIETYFGAVWKYLDKEYSQIEDVSEQEKIEHLFRSFYVYLYDLIFQKKQISFDSLNEKNLEKYFKDFVCFLNGIKSAESLSEINPSDKTSKKVIFSSLIFKPFLFHLHNKYSKIVPQVNLQEYAYNRKTNEILDTLKQGKIYWKKIEYPEIIIYRLKKEKLNNLKLNIATILSFWNTFHLKYGKNLYKMTLAM